MYPEEDDGEEGATKTVIVHSNPISAELLGSDAEAVSGNQAEGLVDESRDCVGRNGYNFYELLCDACIPIEAIIVSVLIEYAVG